MSLKTFIKLKKFILHNQNKKSDKIIKIKSKFVQCISFDFF